MSDYQWPYEIWAAAQDEFDPRGFYVTSKYATTSLLPGDPDDFERYVLGDFHDSQDSYFRAQIAALKEAVADRDQLFNIVRVTIGMIVAASGGEVEVPRSIIEDIHSFDLEKAEGIDGSVIYRTRRKKDDTT